ncbi:chemotaxis protein CheW [Pseudodesulfovibrio sediminis]|uniref:CheW-like domain-containing protein n=1 Tax=Pseudodesulfovibrio sediminis TaxID=2810563 RepID=A0ABN6EU60_9BACT|nr:chemotaxis protein CheW [Pseudodesulfovibrio sediminis]BCS89862.1 hypothetical protein PSDVSF_31040 [Pseudodesulfovibrio sediminis]
MSASSYHDFSIPQELLNVVPYMESVEGCREELSTLGSQWDLLTILGQMSGTGTDMTGTREGFQKLASELLGQLGLETLKKVSKDIDAKAQVVVDIVIRNLFERTADIGFLATDSDIRDFLGNVDLPRSGKRSQLDMHEAIVERFREYVEKYSVYFDIVLFDTQGNIAARLDPQYTTTHSDDAFISEALTTSDEYVEYFGKTEILSDHGDSLIYAYRVTETDASDSTPLGVLALCFRFQNEMDGIFKNLIAPTDWVVLTLLDKDGRVIASSDQDHVRIGSTMELALQQDSRVVRFAGREYLAKTCATNGYESFFGLGWYGHAMLPLEHAFNAHGNTLTDRADEKVLAAVMNDPRLFSEELRNIPIQADLVQSELERTVWNGNVKESDSQSKVLLWNISDAGARTKLVFEKAIDNLHETVVSAILDDVEFQAALAVDIMDRNLYERANDCRWWALTSAFRRILAKSAISDQDVQAITDILIYINDLYTVYTALFIYDSKGTILAISDPEKNYFIGRPVSKDWITETLEIQDSQQYSVSPFETSNLYEDKHTYIYGASITDSKNPSVVHGGIGIIFDSEPQFKAMLEEIVKKDEGTGQQGFGLFTDRKGRIISSTDAEFAPGASIDIDHDLFTLKNGSKTSRIIEFRDQYYAVGASASSGYREYKRNDNYSNDVIALIFSPLAEISSLKHVEAQRREMAIDVKNTRPNGEDCTEIASFHIGNSWLGFKADIVVEATRFNNITPIPGAAPTLRGKVLYDDKVVPVIAIHTLMGAEYPRDESSLNIVFVQCDSEFSEIGLLGLIVDSLAEIPAVSQDCIDSCRSNLEGYDYTECMVKPEQGCPEKGLLVVLNPERLVKHLVKDINYW